MKRISLLLLCAAMVSAFGAPMARAIELSLEENRAERGSVGFVDIKRLFAASPDATRAREGLEELVRQAEERVNTKKAELLRLRQNFGTLQIEREELARSTPTATVPAPPKAAEEFKPVPTPVTALPPSSQIHGAIPPPESMAQPPIASAQATPALSMINLPGLTDGPLNLERPGASPLNPTRDRGALQAPPTPAVEVSTPLAPAVPSGPTLAQRLLEIDGRIVAMQGEVDRQQGELDRERLGAERTLLDAESRKTDQVLARLYRAISEVAKREGVSVVVDNCHALRPSRRRFDR